MYRSFSPNPVRPNLPLRKPSSTPVAPSALLSPLRHLSAPGAAPLRPASGAVGDGPLNSEISMDTPAVSGSSPKAIIVYFCNFCGQQGHFRCTRCKKAPYCSVVCQREDWKAHKHTCKPAVSELAQKKPKETTVLPEAEDKAGLLELKRVYLKDLHVPKIIKGTDIQAVVVEFYHPGRFFLFGNSPELLEALQSISTELQKTYSCPTETTYVPCVGEVCAVQFSCDLRWYRGLVQTLTTDQKKANILYIDFGNEEDVPVDRIKPLNANIKPFCPSVMECCIAGVVPVTDTWSDRCCLAVRQLLADKTVTVKLVETLEGNRIHMVDILLSVGKQLSTFLVEQGYAVNETAVAPTEQEINAMVNASFENFRLHSDGKDDNTWAQPPEPLMQAVGDSFFVVVTHFQSPNDIIVQKVENAGIIQELQRKLREHCCRGPPPRNFRPAPGTVCCAQFSEDKQWYRAKVLAYSSEERVCVGYLDFGNSEEVDLDCLQPISTSLLALPTQAVPCGLAAVQPVGERWSGDCLLALKHRVSNRILRIEILGAHEGKALVAMIDEASDPQANVAELLTSAGFAAPAPVPTGSEQQVDQTATVAMEPQVPASSCEPLVWSSAELPSDGQRVALLANVMENPQEFYCCINNPADHRRLIELAAELKQHCEATVPLIVPRVGEPCCAMFPVDGAWYRAMVKELSEDKVSVKFVDYGHSMEVEKNHLRSITPQLLTLPFQAIRCWLAGVEPSGSEWSSDALLWFQTLVDGEPLSARVLSVTQHGYGVELESRGQNVAAALIAERLAKAPEELPKETHAPTDCKAKQQEKIKENELIQMHAQAFNQTEVSSKEVPSEGKTATLPEVSAISFPLDWKTVELPLNETFKPCVAAAISPSLFYLLSPNQADQQRLQEVMTELAAHCAKEQASPSAAVLSRAAPGAACCAQFSADNSWYRAVVLEVCDHEMRVVYADYGNSERVPPCRVLPIPAHLLQLPFHITRCTLGGRERFPVEWPEEVQLLFQSLLLNDVLATVQSFDGSANVLSLTLAPERGGGHLAAMISDALQEEGKSKRSPPSIQRSDRADGGSPPDRTAVFPDGHLPNSVPENQKKLERSPASSGQSVKPESDLLRSPLGKNSSALEDPIQKVNEQMEPPAGMDTKTGDPRTTGCCCLSLKTKIDQLEQLMQLQLSLIKQLVGQREHLPTT